MNSLPHNPARFLAVSTRTIKIIFTLALFSAFFVPYSLNAETFDATSTPALVDNATSSTVQIAEMASSTPTQATSTATTTTTDVSTSTEPLPDLQTGPSLESVPTLSL